MKRIISILIALTVLSILTYGAGFQNESLKYVITYKWGLIHKDAGEATLSLRRDGNNYNLMLAARTKPWADKFYQVRDTLLGNVRISGLQPLSYSKIAHEKGKYGRDDISYSHSGGKTTGTCRRHKIDPKRGESRSEKKLEAQGPVYDMLSIFYYLRQIDYDALSAGKEVKATVFSGSKAETITIRCLGKENVKLRNGTQREAYHIQFNFTTEGRKKSSDDIDTWISTDSRHIPYYLVGKLPVGQVRAYYTGG